ncbi:MAG TPA: CoA transferase, partial [Acidimicrobiales bacterium]
MSAETDDVVALWRLQSRYADVISRRRHERELDALVAEWVAAQERDEALERLAEAGVPAAIVRANDEAPLHLAHLERGFFDVVERAHVGAHLYPGLPI